MVGFELKPFLPIINLNDKPKTYLFSGINALKREYFYFPSRLALNGLMPATDCSLILQRI
jgi:hypothetical protein